jgi:hypothetical protein
MSVPEDALMAYWKEQREQFRQSESQRAVLTNFVLVITAAISGLVVQQHFNLRTLPVSVLIILIGLYGALATAKYHERAEYHLTQARALTRMLVDAGVVADSRAILQASRDTHYSKYPRLHRLRLHWLWTGLHLGIAAYGVALIIITCLLG